MKKNRLVAWMLAIFLVGKVPMIYAQEDIQLQAKSAVLMEVDSGEVILNKNGEQQLPPASITKLMTYLLAMEAVEDGRIHLEDQVKISEIAASQRGSRYYLRAGEEITLGELIQVMMIVSANDTATAIAEYVGGDVGNFVEQMNERARKLGLTASYFVNPNGMPEALGPGNQMTAKDIALLSQYLIQNYAEQILPLTDTLFYENKERNFYKENTNGLLKVLPEVDGLKTGYTDEAGYCLSSTLLAKADEEGEEDFRLVAVILGTQNEQQRVEESKKLLEYGVENFTKKRIVQKGERIEQIHLWDEEKLSVGLLAQEDRVAFGPREGLIKNKEIFISEDMPLWIDKGEVLGTLVLTLYNDEKIKVDLISDRKIRKIPLKILFTRMWVNFTSFIVDLF